MLKKQLAKFNHLMQGIEKFYEEYAKTVGLTYMSLTVLEIIYHAETPCTQKEICDLSHYNKQVVNMIVKSFKKNGYVKFTQVSEDRRNKYVILTEYGKTYADMIMFPLEEMEEKALTVLSVKERAKMLEMLERCYDGYKRLM